MIANDHREGRTDGQTDRRKYDGRRAVNMRLVLGTGRRCSVISFIKGAPKVT